MWPKLIAGLGFACIFLTCIPAVVTNYASYMHPSRVSGSKADVSAGIAGVGAIVGIILLIVAVSHGFKHW